MSISARANRVVLSLAAILLLGAGLIAIQAARLKPVVQVRLVHAPAPPRLDAAGCPIQQRCRPGSTMPPKLLAAIDRALPGSEVQAVSGTYDAGTSKPYRLTVVARLGSQVRFVLVAQRLPGALYNDPESFDGGGQTHTDLAGNAITDSRTLHAVVPGQLGCSVQLTLTSVGAASTYDQAALRLARDPDVQLTP
ncbi:MAG: hypothetical protein ABI418_21880 [Jatrophihabitantaceae bacterium]